jgi:two-component system chemotaxis response regulator CheB
MKDRHMQAVVIGASAGALGALSEILPALPGDYPLPIMIVVHLPPEKESLLADIMSTKCKMNVREAEDKESITAGTIYFAPPDYHLLVEKDKFLSLSNEEPVLFSRPSIDILFESAAACYGENLIGIILTGANNDGAKGLRAVSEAGGLAIVQHPALAAASAMPRAALDINSDAQALSLGDIAIYLNRAPIL